MSENVGDYQISDSIKARKLTNQEIAIVKFALDNRTSSEITNFFKKIEEKNPYGIDLDQALNYARQLNTWLSNKDIRQIKNLINTISIYEELPFYEDLLYKVDDFYPLKKEIPAVNITDSAAKVKDDLEGLAEVFRITSHNVNTANSKLIKEISENPDLLSNILESNNEISGMLGRTAKILEDAKAKSESISDKLQYIKAGRIDNIAIKEAIEDFKNDDYWLTNSVESMIEYAQNSIQTFTLLKTALERVNRLFLDNQILSTYRKSEKSELKVIGYDYNFNENKPVLICMNDMGNIFNELIIPGVLADHKDSESSKDRADISEISFKSWN